MADFRVTVPLFQGALVSGLASGSRQTSSAVQLGGNLAANVVSAVAIVYNVSSVASTADVGFFYANSLDGVTFGSYTDNAALQASTFSTANSTGLFVLSLPPLMAPYVRFTVSGTGSNPVDTRVNASLMLRMS
jgi:hypothetical protein